MRSHTSVFFLCGLSLSLASCKKSQVNSEPPREKSVTETKIDVCSLLQPQEIEAVQNSPVKETKDSASSDGTFRVSQCFYTAGDLSRSINLALTQSDQGSAAKGNLTQLWQETFSPYRDQTSEHESDRAEEKADREGEHGEEDEEKRTPPKKIEGIGDDAYWMGRDALYVLKGNLFIRLSLGGPDSVETKIEKAKTLAAKALGRLSEATK